jgi:hypothetical protein
MVYVAMASDVFRKGVHGSWIRNGLVFWLAATLTGIVVGASVGAVGSTVDGNIRAALATVGGLAAVVIGVIEMQGRVVSVFQLDRETPQRWVRRGGTQAALLNGTTLAFGLTTRVGFWLWYVIPLSAFLSGHAAVGAAVYGTFAFVRGGGVWVIAVPSLLSQRQGRQLSFDDVASSILDFKPVARAIAAAQLTLLGVAVVVWVGF